MKLPNKLKSGFTLVEMTVVIVFGMALATTGLALLNQQINTVRIFNKQDFILSEAPQINNSLVSLLSQAQAIRLHNTFADAINDQNPVLTGGKVLVAAYPDISGSPTFGIINLEDVAGQNHLTYYILDRSQATLPTLGNPSWTISRKLEDVDFNLVQGLFETTLTGPKSERITYTISPNQ